MTRKLENCNNCHTCLHGVLNEYGFPILLSKMIVCPECKNKRCPKATKHDLKCTGSNEPDQLGSVYSKNRKLNELL
jgi:hypothetical protein